VIAAMPMVIAALKRSSPSGSRRSQPGMHDAIAVGSSIIAHTRSGGAVNVYEPVMSM